MIRIAKAIIRSSWFGLVLAAAAAGCAREEPLKGTKALEFRLLANTKDDADALEAAKKDLAAVREEPKRKEDAQQRARDGRPPAPVAKATDKAAAYSWVEVGRAERHSLHLDNAAETDPEHAARWKEAAAARARGEPLVLHGSLEGCLLFSRPCENTKLSEEERKQKKIDYFLLTRDPFEGKAVTGEYLTRARAGEDPRGKPCVLFSLNKTGGDLFHELSSANVSSSEAPRHLAILLDGVIVAAPKINSPIRADGMITGDFTEEEVEAMVRILRAGPAAGR
jgi:hypothetical protein